MSQHVKNNLSFSGPLGSPALPVVTALLSATVPRLNKVGRKLISYGFLYSA